MTYHIQPNSVLCERYNTAIATVRVDGYKFVCLKCMTPAERDLLGVEGKA